MIRTDKLRGKMAEHGVTGVQMAEILGIAPKTFYEKMKKGIFGSDEMQAMIDTLSIEDPKEIFFAKG